MSNRERVDELKNLNEPAIFCSNHLSSFDIIAMYMSWIDLFFLLLKKNKANPIFGWYMTIAGMIFLDRSNHENAMRSMRNAGNEIKKEKYHFFPEVQDQKQIKLDYLKEVVSLLQKRENTHCPCGYKRK